MSYNNFIDEIDGEEEPSLAKLMLHMGIIGILIAVVYLAFY